MKTLNTILISGASGKFSEISGLGDNAKKSGSVILKNVVFQPQTNLWAGYGTPLDNEGNKVIEEKNGRIIENLEIKQRKGHEIFNRRLH